jgi:hypothetical protein
MSDPVSGDPATAPHDRPRCVGTSKQTGERCGLAPARGATVCKWHGAGAPQVRAAAERRLAHEAAERAVATLGLRRDIGPEEALLEELQWTAGHVAWLRQRVQDLDPEALVWGVTEEKDVGSGERPGLDVTQSAQPSIWWELYRQERKHLLAVIHEANTARIDERRIRLAEQQGSLVAEVIRRSFDGVLAALLGLGLAAGLVEAWPGLVRDVVGRELRALGGAS